MNKDNPYESYEERKERRLRAWREGELEDPHTQRNRELCEAQDRIDSLEHALYNMMNFRKEVIDSYFENNQHFPLLITFHDITEAVKIARMEDTHLGSLRSTRYVWAALKLMGISRCGKCGGFGYIMRTDDINKEDCSECQGKGWLPE